MKTVLNKTGNNFAGFLVNMKSQAAACLARIVDGLVRWIPCHSLMDSAQRPIQI